MRRGIVKLGAAVAVAATVSAGRMESAASGSPEIAQTTIVRGTAPSLEGRWLLVTSLGTGSGRRSTASLWEITRIAGQLALTERFVKLPGSPPAPRPDGWEPTPAELQAVATGWDTLPSESRGISSVSHEIIARDGFDDVAAKDPLASGALWIVRQRLGFVPGASHPASEVRVLAAGVEDEHGYRGKCMTTMIALAPLPLPIEVPGTFRLMRLPAASRPFWRWFF